MPERINARRLKLPAMAAVSVRLLHEQLHWLNNQAAQNGTTMGEEVRIAVTERMSRSGDLERYGIHPEEPDPAEFE